MHPLILDVGSLGHDSIEGWRSLRELQNSERENRDEGKKQKQAPHC
jgi:hypothetical protein